MRLHAPVHVSFGEGVGEGGERMHMATEASADMLADLPVASALALALRQVSGELAKLQQGQEELKTLQRGQAVEHAKTQRGQEELKTLQRGQAVEHAKTQQGLAELQRGQAVGLDEVKTELAELRLVQSEGLHVRMLQGDLAIARRQCEDSHAAHVETTAALAAKSAELETAHIETTATLAAKSAELETAHAELQTGRVRSATPFVKGSVFHKECKLWIEPLALKLEDTHLDPHSGDAVITLPCDPPMRILIDFKNCDTLENLPAYMSTVVLNAAVVDAKQKEEGKTATIDAVMLMYPDGTILPPDWAKNTLWLRKPTSSKKTGEFRADRMVVCSRSTFMFSLAQLFQSIQGGVGIDPHLHDFAMRVSTSVTFFFDWVAVRNLLKASNEFSRGSSDFNDMDKNLPRLLTFMKVQSAEIKAAQVAYSSTNKSMIDKTHADALNVEKPSVKDKRNKKYWDSMGEDAAAARDANQTTDHDIGIGTWPGLFVEPRVATPKRKRDGGSDSSLSTKKERKAYPLGIGDE